MIKALNLFLLQKSPRTVIGLQKYIIVPLLLVMVTVGFHLTVKQFMGGLPRQSLMFGLPILISVIYGGYRAGVIATLFSILAADFFFFKPLYSLGNYSKIDFWREVTFLVEGFFITFLLQIVIDRMFEKLSEQSSDGISRYSGYAKPEPNGLRLFGVSFDAYKNFVAPFLFVAATAALQFLFGREIGLNYQHLIFAVPILMAVIYGGFRAGVVATMLTVVAADLFFFRPLYSIGGLSAVDKTRMGANIIEGLFISGFVQVVLDGVLVKALAFKKSLGPSAKKFKFTGYADLVIANSQDKTFKNLFYAFIVEVSNSQFLDLISIVPLFLLQIMKVLNRCPTTLTCIITKASELRYGIFSYFETFACLENMALLFLCSMCFFMLDRSAAVSKDTNRVHRTIAFIATLMPLAFFLVKANPIEPWEQNIAITLLFWGTIIATCGLLFLGRSFGVIADARELKTNGIYRFVRHPVYLGEMLMFIGTCFFYRSWGANVICVAVIVMQVIRIKNEERNLTKAFPEYAQYAKRTGMFLPHLF